MEVLYTQSFLPNDSDHDFGTLKGGFGRKETLALFFSLEVENDQLGTLREYL